MKHILLIIGGGIVVLSAMTFVFTITQVEQERASLSADLQYRTRLLADSLKESVEPSYRAGMMESVEALVAKFTDRERLAGLAVLDRDGVILTASGEIPEPVQSNMPLVTRAMDFNASEGEFLRSGRSHFYVFASPLRANELPEGVLLVIQDADYIDSAVLSILWNNFVRFAVQVLFYSAVVLLIVRWIIVKPLSRLAESVKSVRAGKGGADSTLEHPFFFQPLAHEIFKMSKSLTQARSAASEEARMRLEKLDTPWTAERLKEFVKGHLKDRPIVLVSNREPYVHNRVNGETQFTVPASGLVTALEPVMEACGGLWIAHGSGSADRETADEGGKLQVPPEEPHYTLKRVWLTQKDIQGFYTGFSNEALWPLCHTAHNRPIFRKEDWLAYRRVNGKFAEALLGEIKNLQNPIILVQDYHFALLPHMIKKARPDASVGLFWHIPWPGAESFSICPWRKELLDGMLGADLIGFHTQQYCNNFMDTVGKEIEARIDFERFGISRDGHISQIEAFPISIAFTNVDAPHDETENKGVFKNLGIETEFIGLGVDRLDYTKGILERFKAIEFFLDAHRDYVGKFTFLQISSPSRETSQKYREYSEECSEAAQRINDKFATGDWKPIVFEKRHFSHEELRPLYANADFCLVTSLHDGMNLVAKEFVAARNNESGVLILSQFAGASRDLKGSIVINPYSAEDGAEAIHSALTMSPTEQHRRMKAMRNIVRDNNVYRWSAEFLKTLANLV